MLSKPISIGQKESTGFAPLPEDVYQVELLDVADQEKATYDTKNKPISEQEFETVLNFQFTLLDGRDGENSLRGRNVWANFIPTYFYISKKTGKNKLFKIVEALLGRYLTQEDYTQFQTNANDFLNSLIGKQCCVLIEHKQSGDKVFANIANYMKATNVLVGLTPDEKEKARVKKESVSIPPGLPKEITAEEIPF